MALRILKRTAFILLEILAVVVTVAIAGELIIRMSFYIAAEPSEREAFEYKQMLAGRIQGYWLRKTPIHDFVPPFDTYADRGYEDPQRLRWIYESTKLPPSRTWTSYDFLQAPERAEETKYTIHSNSLGFRGAEATKEKPKNTYRVIVLGSYHAFGHGVEDNEAYAAQLQAELNRRLGKTGKKFEVWNGGKHAATAIVGLSRLTNEIFDYNPDLLVFDYGMVDNNIWDDNFFPSPMGLPETGLFAPLKRLLEPLRPAFQHSYLLSKIRISLFRKTDENRVRAFTDVLSKMASLARMHKVPFLMLRELPAVNFTPKDYLSATLAEPWQYIDVDELFRMHPVPHTSQTYSGEHEGWTSEIKLSRTLRQEWSFQYFEYRLDYYQLNPRGHKLIAEALADRIQENLFKRSPSTVPGSR